MLDLTRRNLFVGVAAGAATTPMPRATVAAAPTIKSTGIFSYKVGDYDIVQLRDGARTFAMPDTFVVNVSKDQAIQRQLSAYIPDGQVTIPFSPMIVNTGSSSSRSTPGMGWAPCQQQGRGRSSTLQHGGRGIDPKQIDIVVISHFHGDHIGGLKNADGSPAFPNAEIKVPAVEAAFWADDGNQSKANGFNKAQFLNVKKMMEGLRSRHTRLTRKLLLASRPCLRPATRRATCRLWWLPALPAFSCSRM
jgi:hypothetical protein